MLSFCTRKLNDTDAEQVAQGDASAKSRAVLRLDSLPPEQASPSASARMLHGHRRDAPTGCEVEAAAGFLERQKQGKQRILRQTRSEKAEHFQLLSS